MKSIRFFILVMVVWISTAATAQHVSVENAAQFAKVFLGLENNTVGELLGEPVRQDGITEAWLFESGTGKWVVIAADSVLGGVLAYGNEVFTAGSKERELWTALLARDYSRRRLSILNGDAISEASRWSVLPGKAPLFQQWPPDGSTPTGGWILTNWTQSHPYNMVCPIDQGTGNRSVVGCPATAMAQIFNYNRSINYTRLDDSDDYYHSYGAGNQYWIDNDYASRGFLPFPSLSRLLDSIQVRYNIGIPLTDSMKAALSFAAGVAARQVYTSSVSGTFGLSQAYDAIIRFGFDKSVWLLADDPDLKARIADNMKNAIPAQLGLLVPNNGGGHNVVVDGYNTDEFYHFNFGWGGSANGWYTLPPTSIPYNLTIIEGAIVDILCSTAEVSQLPEYSEKLSIQQIAPQQWEVTGIQDGDFCELRVYNSIGQLVWNPKMQAQDSKAVFSATLPGNRVYLLMARSGKKNGSFRVFIP